MLWKVAQAPYVSEATERADKSLAGVHLYIRTMRAFCGERVPGVLLKAPGLASGVWTTRQPGLLVKHYRNGKGVSIRPVMCHDDEAVNEILLGRRKAPYSDTVQVRHPIARL